MYMHTNGKPGVFCFFLLFYASYGRFCIFFWIVNRPYLADKKRKHPAFHLPVWLVFRYGLERL